jgi:acyl-CoA dehydrogenase
VIRDPEVLEALLETVRRFVRERLIPNEHRLADADAVPPDIVREMKAIGLFGLTIPESYGGLGLTMEEEIRVAFELGQTSPAFRSLLGTNNGIGSQGLILDGTEEQKQRYLPLLASGELIGSFALTEPEVGSDAGSVQTMARRVTDGYLLSGRKRFITNAPEAGLFTVLARTDTTVPGPRGLSIFLVEANTPGLSLGKPDRKMGQQGAHTCDVVLDDCLVPTGSLLGAIAGRGFATAMRVLDRGRLHLAAVCVGIAERLLQDSLRYARDREQFGRPIAEFQLIQAMLADSKTEAYAARAMVTLAAQRRDLSAPAGTEAACCKLFASEMVGRVADRAVQIHGGAGYMQEYGIERFYRDVRLFRIYEGTSEIQRLVIARDLIREMQCSRE